MRSLKEVKKYTNINWNEIPEVKWEFIGWFKNCFEYQFENKLLTIRDYDYRDSFTPVMESFLITPDDKTVITEFKIGQGDELYKSRKELTSK